MDNNGSITEFFYNIIPGILFLFFLNFFYHISIFNFFKFQSDAEIILGYIVIGLFLGFLFQSFTKKVRGWSWNKRVFLRIKEDKNNNEEFDKVCLDILGKDYKRDKCTDVNKIFYLMDNDLRGREPAFLPTHFSARVAFWANISWGIVALILLQLIVHPFVNVTIFLFLFLIYSVWMADEHLFNFYDSILKSYYMKRIWSCKNE